MTMPDESVAEFTARYERIAPALCVWAMHHVHRTMRARVEVDDVLQEIWLRAYRLRDRFHGDDAEFRAWLFRVGKLVLLEVQRSVRKLQRLECAGGSTTRMFALDGVAASVTALSRRLLRDESLRRFCDHLGTLPREDQELVTFCGLEGDTCAEAARKLGIGTDAAIKRWQRLRARLREEGLRHDWVA